MGDLAETLLISSESRERSCALRPKKEAVALLSEIIARLHGVDMPVIQFIQVSGEGDAADVPASFAHASAACLGRTLLVRSGPPKADARQHIAAAPTVATVSRRRTRKVISETIEIVPDSAVPSLFYAFLGREPAEASFLTSPSLEKRLDGVTLDFKLVVIESGPPERCPASLDLATRCHGSVMVVSAGITTLSQSRIVMRQVQLAGGTLLGSVLHDAPSLPRLSMIPWFRWLIGKSRE